MLAVSPLRSCNDEREGEMESFSNCENLLEDIDFDDLFVGIEDGDVLPDLEMDQEIFSEFFGSSGEDWKVEENGREEEDRGSGSNSSGGDEIVSKRDDQTVEVKEVHRSRKSATQTKGSQGKRKLKVDWTPELHRRFVLAVEQLGMDKAVPSRILELMGTDCLTRHNIASHLQKYRSHQKHLRAREAEAASWNQRRQVYGVGGGGSKKDMSPWLAPTMGFPPPTSLQPFRPLHVWGHPTVDQSVMHMWPKHLAHSLSPPPWAPHPPPAPLPAPADPSYWHPHHQRVPTITPGTPCFPQAHATARFPIPPVPGFPPQAAYRVDHGIGIPSGQSHSHPPFDFHPSKESIDAAIGDVLSKPWQPLPLGLKPPSLEGVMVELQRQGVPKIPSNCASSLEKANGDTAILA